MTTFPQIIEEEGRTFKLALPQYVNKVKGAEIVATTGTPEPIEDLGRNLVLVSEEERAKLGRVAPALLHQPYVPAESRLFRIRDATVYNFSRVDGMVVSAEGNFVRETRGSPRMLAGNQLVRTIENNAWYFNEDAPIAATLERAFLGFDPATPNYAHFLGLPTPHHIRQCAAVRSPVSVSGPAGFRYLSSWVDAQRVLLSAVGNLSAVER